MPSQEREGKILSFNRNLSGAKQLGHPRHRDLRLRRDLVVLFFYVVVVATLLTLLFILNRNWHTGRELSPPSALIFNAQNAHLSSLSQPSLAFAPGQ